VQAWLKEHVAAAKGRTRSVLAGNGLITGSTTVQLLEEGRQVAAAVRKAIVSTRQPAAQAKAARKRRPRKSGLPGRR
jgi:hypothetical protein